MGIDEDSSATAAQPQPPVKGHPCGVDTRYFAGDPEGCRLGWAWRRRPVAGDPVALQRAFAKQGILKQA